MPDAREALREKVAQTLTGWDGTTERDGTAGWVVDMYREAADALMPLFADVWEDGARRGAVEFGRIEDESRVQLAPGDNPYREEGHS